MPCRTLLALSLSLALTSHAQASPEDPAVLDKIEVKGFPFRYQASDPSSAMKTETALKDTPQAVTVVTEQQIDDQALHGMADILRYVPGVGMAQGEGHRDAPVMRGNASTGDFFTDGIRDDVQYFRDLYNVSQVEVLKGPNAMIFGRGGSGGVINRVSKQADGGRHQAFSFQAGSTDFLRAEADVGEALSDTVAYRFNALLENAGSFRNGVSSSLRGFAPGMAFGIDGDTRVVLSAELFTDSRTVDRGIPSYLGKPLETARSLFFGRVEDSTADTDAASFDALIEHDMDGAMLRNRTRIADYGKFYQNVYPGAVNAGGTAVAISAYNNRTDRTNLFNQTDYVLDVIRGDVTHRIVAGAELGRQNTANFRETGYFGAIGSMQTSELVPVGNPVPTLPVNFRQSASDADNQGTAETAAVYVQDQLHIGERWQIIAGLRFDRFTMDFHNKRNGTRLETADNLFSPRAGVIYRPSEALSFYASYAESFVPRAGEQLASLTPSTANLAPEAFANSEIGMKWQLSKGLFTSVAVYQLDRNNVAVTDPADPTQTLLIDAQRSRGLEWEIGGNITRNLQIVAGYAYQDAELTRALSASVPAGTVLPLVPEHSGYVWGRWDINARWGLGFGINGRDKVFTTTSNKVRLPGYSRIDAAVYYKASEHLKLQANIENLADRRYYASAHNDNNISFGSPREVKLSAHLDF
ncbi:MAG: TonB-dependent receptor [Arenimonas sp.]|uniref:TonB-dependent receptor n=1 Tax=Arenimonas sp. TaxID=1872635 RepID=UPI003C0878BA